MLPESWRSMDLAAQNECVAEASARLRARLRHGAELYNSIEAGFQGDPFTHALEELDDLTVYLHWLKRQQLSAFSLAAFQSKLAEFAALPLPGICAMLYDILESDILRDKVVALALCSFHLANYYNIDLSQALAEYAETEL